jgi:succinate dehydrogenase/fumarate reductase-like Fe-S protein
MSYDLCLRLWRGDAAGGDLVDYTVAVEEGEVVLDAVHRVQASQAGDLAVRWNCKAGKCGSCSAEVNGLPKLMCMARLSALPPGPRAMTRLELSCRAGGGERGEAAMPTDRWPPRPLARHSKPYPGYERCDR